MRLPLRDSLKGPPKDTVSYCMSATKDIFNHKRRLLTTRCQMVDYQVQILEQLMLVTTVANADIINYNRLCLMPAICLFGTLQKEEL